MAWGKLASTPEELRAAFEALPDPDLTKLPPRERRLIEAAFIDHPRKRLSQVALDKGLSYRKAIKLIAQGLRALGAAIEVDRIEKLRWRPVTITEEMRALYYYRVEDKRIVDSANPYFNGRKAGPRAKGAKKKPALVVVNPEYRHVDPEYRVAGVKCPCSVRNGQAIWRGGPDEAGTMAA